MTNEKFRYAEVMGALVEHIAFTREEGDLGRVRAHLRSDPVLNAYKGQVDDRIGLAEYILSVVRDEDAAKVEATVQSAFNMSDAAEARGDVPPRVMPWKV